MTDIINAIKQDDFLTFRKLLRTSKLDKKSRDKLIDAVESYVPGAVQETYITAIRAVK